MKSLSIYDLSQRREVEIAAEEQASQELPAHLQNGNAYDLNHVRAVTKFLESQHQDKSNQEGGSPYDCSIRRR